VELSGLIFVALALVWAVALLPKALRQHDEVAQTRSVDRVSDSMRVLARREVVSKREARLVVTAPQVPGQRTAPAAEQIPGPAPVATRVATQRRAAATAARRRRLILAVLVVACLAVGVAAGLGRLPLWTVAVPLGLTLAFLVLARVLVRKERARWAAELARLKARAAAASTADEVDTTEQELEVEPEVEPAQPTNEQGLTVVSGLEETSSFPVGLLDDVTPTTDAGSLWDPLPVTLPTYVTKPRASRSVRTIDLQAPGVSSSGHDAASSALVADAATSTPPDDLPQRAVGS
jgi:hypothetical protein